MHVGLPTIPDWSFIFLKSRETLYVEVKARKGLAAVAPYW